MYVCVYICYLRIYFVVFTLIVTLPCTPCYLFIAIIGFLLLLSRSFADIITIFF